MIGTIEVCPRSELTTAIREATKWYKAHLTTSLRASKSTVPEIVLLSNDQGNLENARTQGVCACSSMSCLTGLIVVEEYIKDLDDGDTLMDMMSANAGFERTVVKRGENIYPEVFSLKTLTIVLFISENTSRHSISNITFRSHHNFTIQFS